MCPAALSLHTPAALSLRTPAGSGFLFAFDQHLAHLFLRQDDVGRHDPVAFVQPHDRHALAGAAVGGYLIFVCADQYPAFGQDEQFLAAQHRVKADEVADPLGDPQRDHAEAAAALQRVLRQLGLLAEAAFGHRQQLGVLLVLLGDDRQAHHVIALTQADTDHTLGSAAGGAHVSFVETERLAFVGRQDDIRLAVSRAYRHQFVAVHQVDGDQAGDVDVAVLADRGALDQPLPGREHEVTVGIEVLQGQDGLHALVAFEWQDVAHVRAACVAVGFGQVVDLLAVDAAPVGEEQHVIVRAAHQQQAVDVVFLGALGGNAAAAADLGPVQRRRGAFDVTAAGQRDHHLLFGDQVFLADLLAVIGDLAAALIAELPAHRQQFLADDPPQLRLVTEDDGQPFDLGGYLAVLLEQFLALQAGEALQAHVQDGLRLDVTHAERLDQAFLRFRTIGAGADQGDNLVQVIERLEVALEDMSAFLGPLQLEAGASGDHIAAVFEVQAQYLAQRQQTRAAVDDADVVDREARLQLGVLVQLVEHQLRMGTTLQFEHDAHALAVGLVAQRTDVLDLLVAHQAGGRLDQRRLVHLVRDLADDDGDPAGTLLEAGSAPYPDAAAAGLESFPDAFAADDAAGREVRTLDVLHQPVQVDVGVVDHRDQATDDLAQVVRRDVGGHADRDAGSTVDDHVRAG